MLSQKNKKNKRITVMVVIVCVLMLLGSFRLASYQIASGSSYAEQAETASLTTRTEKAARGEIVDCTGTAIAASVTAYNIAFTRSGMTSGTENDTILQLQELMTSLGEEWIDELPISAEAPYTTTGTDEEWSELLSTLSLDESATADDCMAALVETYELSGYTETQQRQIAAVRYQMKKSGFSTSTDYTFAEGISSEAAVAVSENEYQWGGVEIVTEANRVYADGTLAPHLIGRLSSIYAEEYAEKKEEGYSMDDEVGRGGIEELMESTLRGTDGVYRVALNSDGEVTAEYEEQATVPGNSVRLTLSATFQKAVQDMLEEHITYLKESRASSAYAGAIVCLDVNTGGILAMATYPSYDINTFREDYSSLQADTTGKPLINRATQEVYRPGSTFKTVTATAGLIEGLVTKNTSLTCTGVYTYWSDHTFRCAGTHGITNIVKALQYSCNVYFYDLGRRLGQDTIASYANLLGLGVSTGFELEEETGHVSSSSYYEENGLEWNEGNVANVAIGQDETYVTVLQMAVQAMTIANKGTRYKVHLIDAITDFSGDTVISQTATEVLDNSLSGNDDVFDTITEGMVAAGKRVSGIYSLSNLGYDVAIKTGTPQRTSTTYNSALIGFAPADNPQVAFAVMIEEGESANYLARQIVEAYQEAFGVDFSES